MIPVAIGLALAAAVVHGTWNVLVKVSGDPLTTFQRGPVLDNDRAYKLLQNYCGKYFARGFKLYKLYTRAAAFVGH